MSSSSPCTVRQCWSTSAPCARFQKLVLVSAACQACGRQRGTCASVKNTSASDCVYWQAERAEARKAEKARKKEEARLAAETEAKTEAEAKAAAEAEAKAKAEAEEGAKRKVSDPAACAPATGCHLNRIAV